ncbi:RcnB family protein [Saezia sanguinis]|uniref:RcnB family protein n=1 Tax=Saezia sanguinis TaxID=1965230 RepID=UPI00306AA773
MKMKKSLVFSFAAVSLLGGSLAMAAQPRVPSKEAMSPYVQTAQAVQPQRISGEERQHAAQDSAYQANQRVSGQTARPAAAHWGNEMAPESVRPAEHLSEGQVLPQEYRGRQYSIEDWKAYGLNPPAVGHRWVLIGGDFIQINNSSGKIASILLSQ